MTKRLIRTANNAAVEKIVREWLDSVSDDELLQVARQCFSEDGSCDFVDVYDLDESELEMALNGMNNIDVFNLGRNSNFNWTDDYFRFDGYGNIETMTESMLYNECHEYIRDIVDCVARDYESFDIPSEYMERIEGVL